MNPLFNKYGGINKPQNQNNHSNNILSQFLRLKNNPGAILDVLLQNGKINQQQYNDMQQFKNNPQMIVNYLINSGNGDAINQAKQVANQIKI